MQPKIEKRKCVGCGACISICPTGVFIAGRDNPVVLNPSACVGCKMCALNCPFSAISFRIKPTE